MKLPQQLARFITPQHQALLLEFIRFGLVGTSGVVVDLAAAYGTVWLVGPYGAGAISYLCAATWTWALNRIWTWRGRGSGPLWREWLRWLGVNTSGLVFNRGLFFILITLSPYCYDHLYIPIALGGIAGMFANFFLARRLVFR